MHIHPMLSAMRRNKVGAMVIAIQMAITLAILCNALFIIEQRLAASRRATGTDEASLFAIDNLWVGVPSDLPARTAADLDALRSISGVQDAYVANTYPLSNDGWNEGISLRPNQDEQTSFVALYLGDQHMIPTLGLKLIAGRNFTPAEVTDRTGIVSLVPPGVLVTRAVAEKLFPAGNALGQSVYIESKTEPTTIIGIVDKLQIPFTDSTGRINQYSENSVIEPYRPIDANASYVVRVQPQRLDAVMQQARTKLLAVNRDRVLTKVRSFSELRTEAYRDDRGLAIILSAVCAALLAVTAFGIVGLTSYWVAQRRRQIGIRRALGATRSAIVRYFQAENLLIAVAGATLGVALAIAVNLWMVSSFEMAHLHVIYPVIGAMVVLLLGQLAVLWPASRAASIPPAMATRTV
jgi:putative ABC transport system permease protein